MNRVGLHEWRSVPLFVGKFIFALMNGIVNGDDVADAPVADKQPGGEN